MQREICEEIDRRVVEAAAWHVRERNLDFMELAGARGDFAAAVLLVLNGLEDQVHGHLLPRRGSVLSADRFTDDSAKTRLYVPGALDTNPDDQIWQ